MRCLLWSAALFLALPVRAQSVITEDAILVGSGTDSLATAGWSVDAAEGMVVVGAFNDNSFPTTGAAYVFRETADGWEEEVRLNASQQSHYTFGFAVAAWSGGGEEVVLVGAHGRSDLPANDVAYVFRREDDGTWIEEARLSNSPDTFEFFGRAVALHGDFAVVGAPGADDVGETTGAAYIFRQTPEGGWVQEARLLASDAEALDGFGRGVAVHDPEVGFPTVLVGAPSRDDQRGAVYVFQRTAEGDWIEVDILLAADSNEGDLYGIGVDLTATRDGTLLALAGSLGDRSAGLQTGAGYLFRREHDGGWVLEEKLTAAEGASGQRLGWSVALAAAPDVGGDAIAVLGGNGAYGFAGTVRLFRRTSQGGVPTWTEAAELWASDRTPGDWLGHSVGASSSFAVGGAPFGNVSAGRSRGGGAGYVWDLHRAVPVEPEPVVSAERAGLTVYPNPAADGPVTLRLRLPRATHVRLDAYDVLGRRVATLAEGRRSAGETLLWLNGEGWPPGTYFLRLQTPTRSLSVPFTLVR